MPFGHQYRYLDIIPTASRCLMLHLTTANLGRPMHDEILIRQLIENWAIWRDSGQWERLATLWHSEGRMITTWSQSSAGEFIARSRRAWDDGIKVLHTMGGASIDVIGPRAVSISRMEIIQRAMVDGVLVDVNCRGRFWDALQKN